MKVIHLTGITCDLETEMLILAMYLKNLTILIQIHLIPKHQILKLCKKYLNTSNTNIFDPMSGHYPHHNKMYMELYNKHSSIIDECVYRTIVSQHYVVSACDADLSKSTQTKYWQFTVSSEQLHIPKKTTQNL